MVLAFTHIKLRHAPEAVHIQLFEWKIQSMRNMFDYAAYIFACGIYDFLTKKSNKRLSAYFGRSASLQWTSEWLFRMCSIKKAQLHLARILGI